jgi:hypothetical protein
MINSAMYQPVAPPEIERRWAQFRQALRLPATLLSILSIVRQDFEASALDDHLWSFWGFHHRNADVQYRARPWQKVQLRAIEPEDVVRIEVWEMVLMLNMAMEDEEPIPEYSHQSGEGFRFLLPTLARFMGRNEEQARFAAQHGLAWCEGAWCAEERRHSNTLARMIERLMKKPPRRDNPNKPMVVTAGEEDALRHLISRQTSEWNASSSYILMAAHATGHLHNLIRNLERDEVKHLCIMSAAAAYLLGPRPWARFLDLVRKGLDNYTTQKKSRSGGAVFGTNPVTAIEGIVAHLLTEFYLQKWLKTVPLRTLTVVFETPSSIPEFGVPELSPRRQAEVNELLNNGEKKRLTLARWAPQKRRQALEQQRFERLQQGAIERIIALELDGFSGAEQPGSERDKAVRKRIRRTTPGGSRILRASLIDHLRDYQVQSNHHSKSQTSPPAVL